MKKIKSILKKAANLDVLAASEGIAAKKSKKNETLAKDRALICSQCELLEDEPVHELAVKDTIQTISNKICGDCACALPFMVRQKRKKCPLGKW